MAVLTAPQTLADRVRELKRLRNAVILAHNYQIPEIQDVADYVGDSLGLAYKARESEADVILFCGVHFMAETAKIVNPTKTVLMPDLEAGCSLADSCNANDLARWKAAHPDVVIVAYINCTAAVKALADIICTSGNAVKVVQSIPADRKILFVPDQNLGQWVMNQTGREMILWPGVCSTHVLFTHKAIFQLKQLHPNARIVAHPECLPAVRMLADEVCSTEKMVQYCRTNSAREFIIVTETGMLHRLRKECPDKVFIPGPTDTCACNECSFMKKNTLEKCVAALENLAPQVDVPEDIRRRALVPIERMLALGR
ncbi:MAG: quinolinate synthase NadA [Verrucomicrobiae bacterium]|nr:quinolinate synthase NadA [Verrucomicrobiae bacterium]MDW8343357.1 quinolinate synthase NadA [Verrucomicrobiae bacterium]